MKNVIINDTDGKCIYNGNTSDGLGGVLTGGSTEYCNKLRNTIADNVTTLLIRCGYDDAQVGTDGIQFDMNKIETLTKSILLMMEESMVIRQIFIHIVQKVRQETAVHREQTQMTVTLIM